MHYAVILLFGSLNIIIIIIIIVIIIIIFGFYSLVYVLFMYVFRSWSMYQLLSFLNVIFCPKMYMEKSVSLIKLKIIMWNRSWYERLQLRDINIGHWLLNVFTLIFENLTQITFNFEITYPPKSHFWMCITQFKDII